MITENNPIKIEEESSFCGTIRNIQLTTESEVGNVHPCLYAAIQHEEITYDLPLDAPVYPKVFLCEPNETDIAQSAIANKKEG